MRISKEELQHVILEEINKVLAEGTGLAIADMIRPVVLERRTGAGVAYDAYKLINRIKKHAVTQKGGGCADWVDVQAKKRGWNMNKLTPQQADIYVKLYKYCKRIRSKKHQDHLRRLKKRKGARVGMRSPARHGVGTLRGGRTDRYLASMGGGAIRRLKKEELTRIIKEETSMLIQEVAVDAAKRMLAQWMAEEAQEVVAEETANVVGKYARRLLKNPNIAGGQVGATLSRLAGSAFTVLALAQAYLDMSEMIDDPNISAEWNDAIASFLNSAGHGLATHGAPAGPKYWGVKNCDQLHGALKNACARWEIEKGIATSPKAAERHGRQASAGAFEGRIFSPLRKGGGWRTYQELTRRERQDPKNYEKWIAWRKDTGRQA